MTKKLREQMPEVTKFIDSLRAAFGPDCIDQQIRKGMKGETTFWASENGHTVGTRDMRQKTIVCRDQHGIAFSVDVAEGELIHEAIAKKLKERSNMGDRHAR